MPIVARGLIITGGEEFVPTKRRATPWFGPAAMTTTFDKPAGRFVSAATQPHANTVPSDLSASESESCEEIATTLVRLAGTVTAPQKALFPQNTTLPSAFSAILCLSLPVTATTLLKP